MSHPIEFANVTATCKANIYFEGKVVSHGVVTQDGEKKTFGVIFPGSYSFNTEAAENMAIIDGACRVKLKGATDWSIYKSGEAFDVPANSSFEIEVEKGSAQYICSFIA